MVKLCALLMLLLVVPAVVFGQKLNVQKCRNLPLPTAVRLADCTRLPCSFRRGTNAIFEIDFLPTRRVTAIKTSVETVALLGARPYSIPAQQADGCANLIRSSCNQVFIRPATQRLALPLSSSLFQSPTAVTFRVTQRAQDNSTISCFEANLRVRLV